MDEFTDLYNHDSSFQYIADNWHRLTESQKWDIFFLTERIAFVSHLRAGRIGAAFASLARAALITIQTLCSRIK